VLEAFDFRLKENDAAHCDTYFNQDVLRANLTQKADMNLVCGHKTEDGEIVWPYAGEVGHALS
jgi:hypothetical protein